MMCQRCEDLEEQVAYLKSELGDAIRGDDVETLRNAMIKIYGRNRVGRRGAARVVMILYRAKGRTVTSYQIMEQLPPREHGEDERSTQMAKVLVCWARKSLGKDAIQNAWGEGYSLSPFGMDLVGRLLGEIAPVPEAVELQDKPPEELRTMAALIAGILAHKDGDGGKQTATTFRRIADRLTGQPRIAA